MISHYWKTLHGWCSYKPEVEKFIRENDNALIVEIGCWKGKSAAFAGVEIINKKKNIRFDTIDWFKGSGEPAHINDPEIDSLYEVAKKNLESVSSVVNVVNSDSVAAAENYEDGSVDLLIIDGDHTEEGVRRDTEAWVPKVKEGGRVIFDDASWYGPKTVVTEMFSNAELKGTGKGKYFVVQL